MILRLNLIPFVSNQIAGEDTKKAPRNGLGFLWGITFDI